jgi:hypothetical protein
MKKSFLIIVPLIALASCAKTVSINKPQTAKIEVPEIDVVLTDPKIKVFQFIEDTSKERPYICLTKTELEKLLYDLQSLKQNRALDKQNIAGQSDICKTAIEGLNK